MKLFQTTSGPRSLFACATLLFTAGLFAQPLSLPMNIPVKDTGKDAMDISWLNHTPAGKHGFIRVTENGHFANDQGRTKFLGVAIVGSLCFPNREDADAVASYLAKNGINIVRFHFFMNYLLVKNEANAAKSFETFDYFVHALTRRGIYIDLDLYDLYQVTPKGILPDGGRFRANDFFYYSKALEAQKFYASLLLNHVNPHTQRAYKDEPGIAMVELLNENSPFWQDGLQKAAGESKSELEALFIEWVNANKVPPAAYHALLTDAQKPLEPGNISFLSVYDSEAMKRFSVDLMTRYYGEMKTFLKNIGIQIPITGHNSPFTLADLSALSQTMDYTCSHFYWTHGDFSSFKTPLNHFWTLPPQLSRARVAAMPYIVNEFSYSHPNKYRSEGLPEAMAYGGLHDLDALVLFSFHDEWPKFLHNGKPTSGSWKTPNQKIRYHSNLVKDPAIWPLVPGLALSFRQSLVSPSNYDFRLTYNRDEVLKREVRERDYSAEQLASVNPDSFSSRQILASSETEYKKSPALVRAYDPNDIIQLLAFTSRIEREFTNGAGGAFYNASDAKMNSEKTNAMDAKAVRISYLLDPANVDFVKNYDALRASLAAQNITLPVIENGSIFSDTREIERNFAKGTLRVETPRAIAWSGFVKGDQSFLNDTLRLSIENEHLSTIIVAGDNRDLAQASTVYVFFGVNAANTDQQATENLKDFHIGSPYNDGNAPVIADTIEASVKWNRPHNGYRVYAEDPNATQYRLVKTDTTKGTAITFAFQKDAYRYKIIFE
ncbi:hypothetical protein Ga0100231_010665 [Opitutaceae bacterium TAV4]|nr:hypothetical protein Ga0100231_010665 [Opitutaceae bacterium TAV4]RRJ98805.1 hypothetical protein Ga0100230_010775 [Opitutaceae bacterium TAV3]